MDIKAALAKPANAQKFAIAFVDAYLSPAFGTRSKTEIDILVLTCLIDAKAMAVLADHDPEVDHLESTAARIVQAALRETV
jgi:hypothetical protein